MEYRLLCHLEQRLDRFCYGVLTLTPKKAEILDRLSMMGISAASNLKEQIHFSTTVSFVHNDIDLLAYILPEDLEDPLPDAPHVADEETFRILPSDYVSSFAGAQALKLPLSSLLCDEDGSVTIEAFPDYSTEAWATEAFNPRIFAKIARGYPLDYKEA